MKFNDIAFESQVVRYTEEEFFQKLALEGALVDNVIDFFKEGIPSITEKLKSYVGKLLFKTEEPDVQQLERHFSEMQRNRLDQFYLSYREVVVQIPEGFKGEFLPYIVELNAIGNALMTKTNKLISEYRLVLSTLLSNPQHHTSFKDLSSTYQDTATARGELVTRLSAFNDGSNNARARLADVLPQYRDAQQLIKETRELAKLIDQRQLKEIQKQVDETVNVLSILEDQLAKNEMIEVSEAVVKNIAMGAHELAKYVDQVVVFYYMAISAITCVDLMFEKMAKFKS